MPAPTPGNERLIIVSNRLPVTVVRGDDGPSVRRSVGGLATGLRRVWQPDRDLWVGWPGDLSGMDEPERAQVVHQLRELGTSPISLSADDAAVFYEEISNAVLWPICHDRIDRLPLRVAGWDVYESVNEQYADAVARHWRPGDSIWVHDYQLLRLPLLLRQRLPEARIGFFLHVPFPNPEIFFTLPVRAWLVEGLLGADLIGFHTRRYRAHFATAVERLLALDVGADEATVTYGGRRVQLGVFPMGIDAAEFADRATETDVVARAIELRQDGCRLLVGIDRLDYSKGIERRLLSLEQLLARHPEWRERVRLLQVAVPSRGGVRAYRRLRTDVESLVGRINGEYATPTWTPVTYMHRPVSSTMLAALYQAADVMLVTPVRDGMNLVAKEFAASRVDDDGVLMLSEFAGAADELADAIIVNPYDVDGVAESIHMVLRMEAGERSRRMSRLRAQVLGHDVHHWAAGFIAALQRAHAASGAPRG